MYSSHTQFSHTQFSHTLSHIHTYSITHTHSLTHTQTKGVYPQSDVSLAIVDINASKGFVDLWVHLSFAIFAIFDVKRELKLLEMACDQVQTCLIFPLRWACFPIQIG